MKKNAFENDSINQETKRHFSELVSEVYKIKQNFRSLLEKHF